MANKIINIYGGIGHAICCTPAIRKLKEQGDRVIVITPWTEVFENNPNIDELIKSGEDTIERRVSLDMEYRGNHELLDLSSGNRIYGPRIHINEYPDLHLKEIVGRLAHIDVSSEDKIDWYPTQREIDNARAFKKKVTATGKKLGIVQAEGSGIGLSPTAILKKIPEETSNKILRETSEHIYWVQLIKRNFDEQNNLVSSETKLEAADKFLVNEDLRKIFALMVVADIGFGTESMAQHFMGGQGIPFVMLLGRSRRATYAHPSTVVFENPNACHLGIHGCDYPNGIIDIPCERRSCMEKFETKAISKRIIEFFR